MRSPRLLLPLAVAAGILVAGCGDDGPRTTQTRDLPAFTRIDNRDSVDVRVRVGDEQRVRVRAGEKVIGDVRTEVRDGTLLVTFDDDGFFGDDVVLEASVPALDGVALTGSGNVDGDGLKGHALEVRADGSGDIALRGTTGRLMLDHDGSGDADLGDLAAAEARVRADGSGDVDLHVARRLDVALDGSGDVRYRGTPELTSRVDGSGDLTRAG